ncbi:MAG: hypothetical protein JO291_16270 [Acidimicrobiia bacterium]|nr:hypothetical protein [Acidimicrobiia bacterium]
MIVRVLPEGTIDKEFDYAVPDGWEDRVRVGTMVRVALHGRRVGAWVTAVDVDPRPDIELRPLAKITGWGPPEDLVELARWAAWRWAGRPAAFLRTASPPGAVRALPERPCPAEASPPVGDPLVADALSRPRAVLRLPPGADRYPLVLAAATAPDGDALILCPSVVEAQRLAGRLARAGQPVACVAHDKPGVAAAGEWARAAAGGVTVIGARAGAWAPLPDLGRVVVLDEHDERYQAEQAPTWHARDVACERAGRAGRPCLLVSPCPTLEALEWGELVQPSRGEERRGWPPLEVVDRRHDDPTKGGLFSERLVDLVRGPGRVVCVVNRIGRARLLACATCGAIGRCEVCGASVEQLEIGVLRCRRCGTERPVVCSVCGSTRFRNLRIGVTRAREELEALVGEPVGEVTGTSDAGDPGTRVVVGTEAVLHRVASADAVAFLDIDQELTAARYRAPEQALALLALGARVVRGREEHGRLMVQTRQPDNVVIEAALHADPGRVAAVEAPLREALGLPPYQALALVSGPAAPELIERLGSPLGLRVDGPADGVWRLVAPSHQHLCDALAAVERPAGRLRIELDPLSV